MKSLFGALRRRILRGLLSLMPRKVRSATYRRMVRCDRAPPASLVLKLAETRDELEACFRLLHDAYVEAGFMQPSESGLRVTLYHALPTTTTLLAKYGERVVGTISLIRESALGFPLQRIFDIDAIRREGGNIAEVSALAVDRRFQSQGGMILFPLMKFMYEYATKYFDTRHLVIAVNPRHIGLYESLLFFRRLRANPVKHYDFVNGAPAIGAHLDLAKAADLFRQHYAHQPPERNLHAYFTEMSLPNIHFPDKRFFTTNDPVMTPDLINHFFNRRTDTFRKATEREKVLLHAIYDLPAYRAYLPKLPEDVEQTLLRKRQHQRFSVMCPGEFLVNLEQNANYPMKVIECSRNGFRARMERPVPIEVEGEVFIDLGTHDHSRMRVRVLRRGRSDEHIGVFKVIQSDTAWMKFVAALRMAPTHGELTHATRFMEPQSTLMKQKV